MQTCYRHDDRRAGVQCQRCDRRICPQCMNQASVGFHCPECVKGATQKVYTAKSLRATSNPIVTTTLIGLNVLVYLFGSAVSSAPRQFELDYALIGSGLTRLGLVGVAEGEWYRLITGGFLHANLLHIGFNMFALFVLGKQLEPVIGRLAFGIVYASSLLAGSLGVMLTEPNALTVGASGAVFGLFGYAVVLQFSRGVNPMDTGLGGIILINLLFTFAVPGISVGGHVGGLIGGALAGLLLDIVRPKLKLPAWVGSAMVGGFGVACGLAAVAVAGG